jgi:hypothetical protein
MAGKSLCAGHEKQKLDGYTIKQCEADSCLTFQWVDCSLLDGLFKIAELLPRIFKAIQQNVPYYDNQYNVKFAAIGRWKATSEIVPESLLEVAQYQKKSGRKISNWIPATSTNIQSKTVVRVLRSHPNRALAGRCGTISSIGNNAEQQLSILETDLDEVAKLWTKLFTDERWTPYLHMLTAHTIPMIKRHKYLGQFSNSSLEAFHKKVRWMYHHTNREGGKDNQTQESSRAIMLQFWGTKILDIEAGSPYHQQMLESIKESSRPICSCMGDTTVECHW